MFDIIKIYVNKFLDHQKELEVEVVDETMQLTKMHMYDINSDW